MQGRARPMVSSWAAPFVDEYSEQHESRQDGFQAYVAERQAQARDEKAESLKRAGRWVLYAVVSFLIATHTPGWWSFAGWCSTLLWGTGAIFALEQANVARIVSTMGPEN